MAVAAAFTLAVLLVLLGTVGAALILRRPPRDPGRAPLLAHVEALRKALLRIVAAALLALVACLSVRLEPAKLHIAGRVLAVPRPSFDLYDNMAAQLFRSAARHVVPPGVQLVATGPTDAFAAQFTLGLGLAAFAATPVALLELGRFFGPALSLRGRRRLARMVLPATALFLVGALFCYAFVLPVTMAALYRFGDTLGATNLLLVTDLAGFCLAFMLGFGLAFETPVVMLALARSGLVSPRAFLRHWRPAILIVFVAAAILTPDPTVVSQLMLALPVLALYFGGGLLAWRAAPR